MFFSTCTKITRDRRQAFGAGELDEVHRQVFAHARAGQPQHQRDVEQRQVDRRQQHVRAVRPQVRNDHCMPNSIAVWPRPVLGSQPSCTANTMISIRPTQKLGSENPRMLPAMIDAAERTHSGFRPAYKPSGTPKTIDNSTAVTASSIVAGMRCAISRSAGSLNTKLRPRSPCSASHRKYAYCRHSGLIQADAGDDARAFGLVGLGRDQDVHRVADHVHADEHDHRHRQDDETGLEQPADDPGDHFASCTPIASVASSTAGS